eukprot:gnl/TRDRNA2_/TRDRNA2_171754_c1_seq3.p1 gnl/TRDRNA2_/TRDRNA2_171754_c1~~gnl/TRDRNA2_/TRDRNA2_171754_c1_seq3.p1  ORF type:complete len:178 (+),score=28.53 gnl/TRDRNA2_/TRDRNA2_171754_c1_seq3:3-536(+)
MGGSLTVLAACGFDARLSEQPASAKRAIQGLGFGVPLAAYTCAAIVLSFYPIKRKKLEEIQLSVITCKAGLQGIKDPLRPERTISWPTSPTVSPATSPATSPKANPTTDTVLTPGGDGMMSAPSPNLKAAAAAESNTMVDIDASGSTLKAATAAESNTIMADIDALEPKKPCTKLSL